MPCNKNRKANHEIVLLFLLPVPVLPLLRIQGRKEEEEKGKG
jgi:hypothetical protein